MKIPWITEILRTTISPTSDWRGLVCIGALLVCLSCGGGSAGSGGGTPPPPPPSNAIPAITSISPSSATEGSTDLSVTITGYNFIASSQIAWNGSARTTTYNSSTQLQVQITAADLAMPGTAALSVTNPAPGGGNSGPAEFMVTSASNPVPGVLSIDPSTAKAGSPGFILTVNGSNFLPMSTIQWNGVALPTTYLSEVQLEAQVPSADLTSTGFAAIVVVNPSPGGGISTVLPFAISYTPMIVSQAANDLAWDNANGLIYLSVPSLAAANGNTIAALEPTTGTIQSKQFVGSEPDRLAISDDSQFLYVAIDGSSSVRRLALPSLALDTNYSLGADSQNGPFFGLDLQVAPGLPHTTAVSRGNFLVSPVALGGIAIYDDDVERAGISQSSGKLYDSMQWGSDAAIYAINSEITSFDFYVLNVNSGGVSLSKDYQNDFASFGARMHYDAGTKLVYTDDGFVIKPANGQQVGEFFASGYMIPDSSLNRAFFLGQTASQFGSNSFTIESFNLTTFSPIAEIVIDNIAGFPLRFIRWGTSGLAFNDDAGFIYIINDSSFVSSVKAQAQQSVVSPVREAWRSLKNRLPRTMGTMVRQNRAATLRKFSAQPLDSNPSPTITALNPSSVPTGEVGINGFTLTVTGTNLVSLSKIQWNGIPRDTKLISDTELQAQIDFADIQTSGPVTVKVVTPAPGGGTSNALTFSILPATSTPKIPTIFTVNPNFATAGSAGFTVQLSGAWLDDSDTVLWNGSPRQGGLQAQISASDVASPGYAQISVRTPQGIVSNAVEFQILYQPTAVKQPNNDMVWDPANELFYISVPSSSSTHANQVCVLSPTTLAITNCQSGNEPNRLAVSDDGQFLYVGMDGTNSVQRYVLPNLIPDISYSLGTAQGTGNPYFALDLQVAPGAPHTLAVTKGTVTIPSATGGIVIYDDSTPRSVTALGWGPTEHSYDSLQWGADATQLYAANSSGGGDFYTLSVDDLGVTFKKDYISVFWNPGRIHYNRDNGLIYSDDGFHAVDPTTGLPVGIFEVGGGWPMAPDASLGRVFIVAQYIWQQNTNYTLNIFDMTQYVRTDAIPFSTTAQLGSTRRLIRWGSNNLAVNFKDDGIYMISGSFVAESR